MQNLIIDNITLILLLPLWIFLMIMGGRFFSVYVNKKIIYILTLLSSMLGSIICTLSLIKYDGIIEWTMPFIKINNFIIDFGIRADKISLIMAFILFVVSFAVQLFSVFYMKDEKKNYRFFALLNLFNFGMASMLFSPNLFQTYVFWELVGIVSYLLIGFDYTNILKSDASKRVFLINRIGDTSLIAGIIITSYFMYNYCGNFSFISLGLDDLNSISVILSAYTSTPVYIGICALLIIGCIVKSAQFPFHRWLLDAMEAHLPVSALLHSATMVAAGLYLSIRLMPFFTLNSNLMTVLVVTGLLTAIVCSIYASIETQPKKILAYSTSANLGIMFTAIGIEAVKASLILFVVHAITKSMLFLLLPKDKNSMPVQKSVLFFIGALSLSGLILAGFYAKEILYQHIIINSVIYISICIASFLSTFSVIRLGFLLGINRSAEFMPKEFISPLILIIFNIATCLYLTKYIVHTLLIPYLAGILALLFAVILWKLKLLEKFNKTPHILEKIYNDFIPEIYSYISNLLNQVEYKIFMKYKPLIVLSKSGVSIFEWIETNIMNKTVSTTANISKNVSEMFMKMQSGNVQTYNFYALIVVTTIISLIILAYQIIINQMS